MLTKRARATIAGAAAGAVALTAAALLATSASAANGNLLTNPGFEAGSTSGWSCDAGTATVATSPVHSGSYLSPTAVDDLVDCLAAGTNCASFVPPTKWPTIAGAMAWSINWDASNGYAFVNTVGPHLAAMP